ncbi:MAG: S1 RNA-binding domain-containing protein [Myxococcota bacterium]
MSEGDEQASAENAESAETTEAVEAVRPTRRTSETPQQATDRAAGGESAEAAKAAALQANAAPVQADAAPVHADAAPEGNATDETQASASPKGNAAEAQTPAAPEGKAGRFGGPSRSGGGSNARGGHTRGGKGGRGRKKIRDVSKERSKGHDAPAKVTSSADVWSKRAESAGGDSFADLFAGDSVPERARRFKVGDAVSGPVIQIGGEGVFVDLGGPRQQGFFPEPELEAEGGAANVALGTVLKGYVVRIDGDTIVLGKGLGRGVGIDELRTAFAEQVPVEGKVVGVNKGGVRVEVGSVRAFCPMGQLDLRYVQDASVFLNQSLRFLITEIKGEDVVLSRRPILEAEQATRRAELAGKLTPGTRLKGRVARVVDFGAFVDLGGIDGLIPTRELSYDRRRPDQVVSTGQEVEVMVQEIQEKGDDLRITLSLKALADDPWDSVERVAPVGTVVKGTVRRLMDFGAFIELAPGIEGLLHVSELGGRQRHPSSFMNVGETRVVTVQSIDKKAKRISLSPAPEGAAVGERVADAALSVGAIVDVTVQSHESYGIFVQVDGTSGKAGRGLVHQRELGLGHGADVKKAFPLGHGFKAKIIDVKRLALSVKAIAEDEERRTVAEYQASSQAKGMGTFGDLLKKLQK